MKYGNITNPSVDMLKEIATVRRLGFDYVELGMEGPQGEVRMAKEKMHKIKSMLQKFNSPAVTHTAWWMELGSPIESVRLGWLDEFKKIIDVSAELGIHTVNTHSHSTGMYSRNKASKKRVLDNFVKSLRGAEKYAKRSGTTVVLENAGEAGEITSFEDFRYIVGRVPELKVHLDIGHAFIFGGMQHVGKFLSFGDMIEHIHIHDNHGKSDEHLPLGKGKINFLHVARMLREADYDKTITFEIFTKNRKDAARSREYFRKLWVKI